MKRWVGAVVVILVAGGPAAAGATDSPLEDARRAAERTPFFGVVQVGWRDGEAVRHEELAVQAVDGVLVVRGANSVMAGRDRRRLLHHRQGGWDVLWPPQLGPDARPDFGDKYAVAVATGPPVAGRATRVVEVRRGSMLRERFFLDLDTGLMLKREQYDSNGTARRTVGFASVTLARPTEPPPAPPSRRDRSPHPMSATHLPAGYTAPPALDQGYQRVGVYRRSDVVHVLYSDGIYNLSVFEQPGRLEWRHLPAGGHRVAMSGQRGWQYGWAGGEVVLWQAGDTIYTVVTDAPPEEAVTAAASLPLPRRRAVSLVEKLRQSCRTLVGPLA